ncbi:CaiF/GrlA family transcriptional regulator, partial [Salmonella enterica]
VCNAGVEYVLKKEGEIMTGKLYSSDKHNTTDGNAPAGKKKVKQSNHNVYIIPASMAAWADEPLYLVVARWGLQQKRWINRNDIAAAFHMPGRRASFQLSYISRKKERVVCRTRYMQVEGGGSQRMEIFIDSILSGLEEGPTHASPRRRNVPAKQTGPTSRGVGSGMAGNTGLWEQLLKGCREGRDDE